LHGGLTLILVACALVAAGLIAALLLTKDGHKSTAVAPTTARVETTGVAPTDGDWAPITVTRPKVPIIAGGIPVDVDPSVSRCFWHTSGSGSMAKSPAHVRMFSVSPWPP